EPCPFDAQGLRNCGLRTARVGLDDQQYRILRRADLHRPQGLDEILKYPDLQAAQEITEGVFELTNPEAFFRVGPFGYGSFFRSAHGSPCSVTSQRSP